MSLLDLHGRKMVKIGGQAAWKQMKKGHILLSFQWYDEPEFGLKNEPAMFFTCPSRGNGKNVYVIPLPNLHLYVDDNRNFNVARAMMTAFEIAKRLGLDVTSRSDVRMILDAIYEGLQELVNMPPKPEDLRASGDEKKSLGEITFAIDGKTENVVDLVE